MHPCLTLVHWFGLQVGPPGRFWAHVYQVQQDIAKPKLHICHYTFGLALLIANHSHLCLPIIITIGATSNESKGSRPLGSLETHIALVTWFPKHFAQYIDSWGLG